MPTSNKLIWSAVIVLLFGVLIFWLTKDLEVVHEEDIVKEGQAPLVTYKASEYSPQFTYPKYWGEVSADPGNTICPEEDTYRTQDSMSVFDGELKFTERRLPGSESMIRIGIRTRELNPEKLNDCGDRFLYSIASKEVNPAILSSVRLIPTTLARGLWGFYNDSASRLNTEAREQYTFFMTDSLGRIHAIQAYLSFIPYFGSPELNELDGIYKGDMHKYLREGKTSKEIRRNIEEFRNMAESLYWKGE